ncbi:GGDEF domain-containing protein [Sphingomonas nostoxanthinifaciens]|uniref:GGDEF domain-containing protein n=1 Tax=Sphingomonas nostoxanthinifaciens TaxID=2872652 RepID=UPI001CC1DFA6|nr:GGDEF domain-containing protein [Sphingomonas nostoxanthinifaciens]UAK23917.1 GGDEF domain-containing protein [Sphingomonas nostoxanthinifaciens]
MTSPAQHDRWSCLFDDIRQVLLENRLEPTPTNYGLAHHYLTADDATFNSAVDRATAHGGLSAAAAAALMAERNVELSAADLQGMAKEAQERLEEVEVILLGSREAHQDYGSTLATNAAELAAGAAAGPLVSSLLDVTQSMIDKTQAIEDQLRTACEEIRELRESLAEAQDAANRDALTGLPNRRALDARLAAASDAARRTGRPFSIAICDIDHFKAVNDRFGHQIGDEVIKFVATSLSNGASERLFAARYGGEEFVVLFEGADAASASREVDRIRATIGKRDLRVNATGQSLGRLTFSAGVAQLAAMEGGASAMLKRADVALYEAKRAGRNRVMVG